MIIITKCLYICKQYDGNTDYKFYFLQKYYIYYQIHLHKNKINSLSIFNQTLSLQNLSFSSYFIKLREMEIEKIKMKL